MTLAVGKETTRVYKGRGGEEGDMNYLRGPHNAYYGILKKGRISQSKKTDESCYQRILA